jgi:hypothetical protein
MHHATNTVFEIEVYVHEFFTFAQDEVKDQLHNLESYPCKEPCPLDKRLE